MFSFKVIPFDMYLSLSERNVFIHSHLLLRGKIIAREKKTFIRLRLVHQLKCAYMCVAAVTFSSQPFERIHSYKTRRITRWVW
jgi:hypothetical protein